MKTIPGFHPAGMLRMSNFVPDKIVESTHSHQHYTDSLLSSRSRHCKV